MTVIRAAAVQLSPVLYSREGTVEKVIAQDRRTRWPRRPVRDVSRSGDSVLPILLVRPAPLRNAGGTPKLMDQAVTIPSPEVDAIGAAAREADMVVSIGVTERDGGSLYNTQLLFDADGALLQRRRKISPTYHERMVWGQGDGSGLRAVDSAVGRIGQLACFEHFNPLARYALIADGEQIHSSMFPGSFAGELFAQQTEISVRNHALESGAFVLNATGWLDADQQAQIMAEQVAPIGPISGGHFTAIITPQGEFWVSQSVRRGRGRRRSRLVADQHPQGADGCRRPLQPA